ncbi:MAG: GlmU family protein [Chloroherpetonaceae bacterium]|nr:GlmU family protein [Chloroherpetonaceae bacterium]
MHLVLFEDEAVLKFQPLLHLKPIYELTLGMRTLREKFEHALPSMPLSLQMRRQLVPYWRTVFPERAINQFEDDTLFINGRVICDRVFAQKVLSGVFEHGKAYFNGGQLVAFRGKASEIFPDGLPDLIEAKVIAERFPSSQVDCRYVAFMWDLVRLHPEEFRREAVLCEDFGTIRGTVHPRACLVNEARIFVGEGAEIRAGAVLDATDGYVYVAPDAKVLPNAVLMNYVYVGKGATVKIGAKIYDYVYVGAYAKVGGEIEGSIVERYANKQHEGFLGHSYISSWCNLGADTNTSDLKNNYSTIRMKVNGKEIDTKMQFLGLIMGEHSKSGINTMFNTGTVVGMSSNIFGAGFPPKTIGSFQWGGAEGFVRYDLEKALEVARIVMKRRGIVLSPEYEAMFRAAYAHAESEV